MLLWWLKRKMAWGMVPKVPADILVGDVEAIVSEV